MVKMLPLSWCQPSSIVRWEFSKSRRHMRSGLCLELATNIPGDENDCSCVSSITCQVLFKLRCLLIWPPMGVQSSRAFKIVFVVITVKQCSKKHELHQHDVNPLRFESQKANGHVYKAHGQQHDCAMDD
eukprot:scaffold128862_cov15-Tisochrysis_lutea.AAC.1